MKIIRDHQIPAEICDLIEGAKKYVVMVTPYVDLWTRLTDSIKVARKKNNWFNDNKLMYKKDGDWITTKKGKEIGGVEKNGHWGKFVVWPEDIAEQIK